MTWSAVVTWSPPVLHLQGVSGLPAATFAATSTVHVGDPVLAVGNAEGYGGAPTVTQGIISALNRDLTADQGTSALHGLLQTDAAINPGNSGGALVDTAGRVIGITNAIAAGSRGQSAQNIGFAIPTDTVLKALPALRAGRNVGGGQSNQAPTAFLGWSFRTPARAPARWSPPWDRARRPRAPACRRAM